MSLGIANEVFCSCGGIIFEVDSIFCASCGDIACKGCYTDCLTCGKMYCSNCSQNTVQCLKCHHNRQPKEPQHNEKAFLVLDGQTGILIKNSQFMIKKTSIANSRDIKLNLNGKTYRFCYRSMVSTLNDLDKFDYFLFFEEVKNKSYFHEFENQVKDLFTTSYQEEYDDYGNLGW